MTHHGISDVSAALAGRERASFRPSPGARSATIARLRCARAALVLTQNPAGTLGVETLAKRFHVSGMVQGVGFRFFAAREAERLGLAGYVANLPDGRVEVYAIGNAAQIEALRTQLQRGPRMARVERVTEQDAEILARNAGGFSIERDV